MKTTHFYPAFLLALASAAASSAQADVIQVISSNRYVSVSGFAGAADGSMTYSDQQPAPNTVSGAAQWMDGSHGTNSANSSAAQNSSLGPDFFSVSSFLSVFEVAPSILASGTGIAGADAQSFFQATFSVAAPVTYNLSFPAGADQNFFSGNVGLSGTRTASFILSSLSAGTILSLTNTFSYGVFGAQFSGALSPGETYTITYAEHLAVSTDPFQKSGQMNGTFLFAVPEGNQTLLISVGLVSLGLMSLGNRWSLSRRR